MRGHDEQTTHMFSYLLGAAPWFLGLRRKERHERR